METAAEAADVRGDGPGRSNPPWRPRVGAFRLYSPPSATARGESGSGSNQRSRVGLRVIVKKTMLARLSRDIVETFQLCNPAFRYSEALNPKRYLTSPHVGVSNDGHDNANSDLILSVNLVLVASQRRYIVKEILGRGTFGQVAKCWSPEANSHVAVKVIKNHPAYYRQAWVEISILRALSEMYDPEDQHNIVRILDYFVHQRHLCISFELLGSNLYELLKINNHKGLALNVIRDFSQQILKALVVMKDAGIIHCDLKPENILLCGRKEKPTAIKVIDFGSACKEGHTIYSYIQSRYYRSPEVLLGYPYNTAIDMWSVGCIVAELFLGLPLFPGASEFDLLKRMIDIIGGQPPDEILRESKSTFKYFKHVGSIHNLDFDESHKECLSAYQLLTEEEYESREMKKPVFGKKYFGKFVTLEEIIREYPYRRNISEKEMAEESVRRSALVDFVKGLIEFDPVKRWSPLQASRHPFVTGEPFTCPYKPLLETPHIPVRHRAAVEHNPGGGHWAAAGLSPQVSSFSHGGIRQSSPHFHQMAYPTRGGYGSYGSYNDNGFQGSSYGDAYCSPAGPFYLHAQMGGSILGASPDIRQRSHQIPHGSFGLSPTGNFCSMSLGVSPSQFTPPTSQIQVGPTSPGSYGPTSPARSGGSGSSSIHGSPLGKGSGGFSKHHRKRNSSRSYHGSTVSTSYEGTSSQQWQGDHHHQQQLHHHHHQEGFGSSKARHSLPGSNQSTWRQHQGGFLPPASSSSLIPPHSSEALSDKHESSLSSPDPGDWDPNYSDELLLQEDNTDVKNLASEIANGMQLGHVADAGMPASGINSIWGHNHYRPNLNLFLSDERREEMSQPSSVHEMHAGHNRLSRFGQQPLHRFQTHVQSTPLQRSRGQLTKPNFNTGDSQSAAQNRWSTSWGS